MRKVLTLALIAVLPVMVIGQVNKPVKSKIKKMTVTKYTYDKGSEKAFPELEILYDAKGNVIEEKEFDEGTFVMHLQYEYDAANNKIKETEFDASGKVAKITTYKYDANNLRTEKLVYDAKNKMKSKRVYKYESY
ncbi:MAG: RHS repeat protein [Bacteroidales bacterium]|nr:RHS repeat protein [Bacteroidales bacterium]